MNTSAIENQNHHIFETLTCNSGNPSQTAYPGLPTCFAHTLDGTIYGFGSNYDHLLGNGSFDYALIGRPYATAADFPASIDRFALGSSHAIALLSNSQFWGWGLGNMGSLGEWDGFVDSPALLNVSDPSVHNVTSIAHFVAGRYATMIVDQLQQAYYLGWMASVFTKHEALSEKLSTSVVRQVEPTASSFIFLLESGDVWSLPFLQPGQEQNDAFILGQPIGFPFFYPAQADFSRSISPQHRVRKIFASEGAHHWFALAVNEGSTPSSPSAPSLAPEPSTSRSENAHRSHLISWGQDTVALGRGYNPNDGNSEPRPIRGPSEVLWAYDEADHNMTSFSGSGETFLSVSASGRLYSWGIGGGPLSPEPISGEVPLPVVVSDYWFDGQPIVDTVVGRTFSTAVLANGSVVTWGLDYLKAVWNDPRLVAQERPYDEPYCDEMMSQPSPAPRRRDPKIAVAIEAHMIGIPPVLEKLGCRIPYRVWTFAGHPIKLWSLDNVFLALDTLGSVYVWGVGGLAGDSIEPPALWWSTGQNRASIMINDDSSATWGKTTHTMTAAYQSAKSAVVAMKVDMLNPSRIEHQIALIPVGVLLYRIQTRGAHAILDLEGTDLNATFVTHLATNQVENLWILTQNPEGSAEPKFWAVGRHPLISGGFAAQPVPISLNGIKPEMHITQMAIIEQSISFLNQQGELWSFGESSLDSRTRSGLDANTARFMFPSFRFNTIQTTRYNAKVALAMGYRVSDESTGIPSVPADSSSVLLQRYVAVGYGSNFGGLLGTGSNEIDNYVKGVRLANTPFESHYIDQLDFNGLVSIKSRRTWRDEAELTGWGQYTSWEYENPFLAPKSFLEASDASLLASQGAIIKSIPYMRLAFASDGSEISILHTPSTLAAFRGKRDLDLDSDPTSWKGTSTLVRNVLNTSEILSDGFGIVRAVCSSDMTNLEEVINSGASALCALISVNSDVYMMQVGKSSQCESGLFGDNIQKCRDRETFLEITSLATTTVSMYHPYKVPRAYPSALDSELLDIRVGHAHVVALMKDGRIVTWGRNDLNQLGRASSGSTVSEKRGIHAALEKLDANFVDSDALPTSMVLPMPGIVSGIEVCGDTNYLVVENREVWAWGANTWGLLGSGDFSALSQSMPERVALPDASGALKSLKCGLRTCFAVYEDGRIWTWGFGSPTSGVLLRPLGAMPVSLDVVYDPQPAVALEFSTVPPGYIPTDVWPSESDDAVVVISQLAPQCTGASPGPGFTCFGDTWTHDGDLSLLLEDVDGTIHVTGPTTVDGNFTLGPGQVITFNINANNLESDVPFLNVTGCFIMEGEVRIEIDPSSWQEVKDKIDGLERPLVESNCLPKLLAGDGKPLYFAVQKPKDCKSVNSRATATERGEARSSLNAAFTLNYSRCEKWWIILLCVIGAILIVIGIVIIAYRVHYARIHKNSIHRLQSINPASQTQRRTQ
jgi:alpha-tubulin suppressor-like RCC1 family protein